MAVLVCPDKCQASFFDVDDFRTDHTVIEEREQADGKTLWRARCDVCGKEDWHLVSQKDGSGRKAYLTKWPHRNWSLGEVVHSKDHMMHLAKQKGFRPVE